MFSQSDIIGQVINRTIFIALSIVTAILIGNAIAKGGVATAAMLIALPIGIFTLAYFITNQFVCINATILVCFFYAGVTRYMVAPFGLLIDFFLVMGWIGVAFANRKIDWSALDTSGFYVMAIWYGIVVLEIVNPQSNGIVCWFYAMRQSGLYLFLIFGLVFLLVKDKIYIDKFLKLIIIVSITGTFWGLRQMIFGVDAAEYKWLYVDGFATTHVLFGQLRVFSYYSDAGQFGGSQAMFALICFLIATGKVSKKEKIYYGLAAFISFIGFGISGTRGALAVPGAGGILYLIVSRNYKVLAVGFTAIAIVFYILKFTFLFQGVDQVRRMRTALNPQDESFQVRLRNQIKFGQYLATRPFGGGIGAAGFWGSRFNPNSIIATTATDSYYVRIWAETGIIGVSYHMFMFGFFLGKGGAIIWNMRDPTLRIKVTAMYCGMGGIMMASYGNQVFGSMPTGIIMGVAIPLILMSARWDTPEDDFEERDAIKKQKEELITEG